MKYGAMGYIILLGIALGVEIAAGAFIAPVIFHPEHYIGEGILTHFQSGILMTQVFLKTNMVLIIVASYCFLFELVQWIRLKERDSVALSLTVGALVLTSLFVFYYTSFILEAQNMGSSATITPMFAKMHKESEWVIKLLMITQLVLIIKKIGKIAQR